MKHVIEQTLSGKPAITGGVVLKFTYNQVCTAFFPQ